MKHLCALWLSTLAYAAETIRDQAKPEVLLFKSIKLMSTDTDCRSAVCSGVVEPAYDITKSELLECLHSVPSHCKFAAEVSLLGQIDNLCGSSSYLLDLDEITLPRGSRLGHSEIKGKAEFGFCGQIESGCKVSLLYHDENKRFCKSDIGKECRGEIRPYYKLSAELREFVESLYTKKVLDVSLVKNDAVCRTEGWKYMNLDIKWETELSGFVDTSTIRTGQDFTGSGRKEHNGIQFNTMELVAGHASCESNTCSSVMASDKRSFTKTELVDCLNSVPSTCKYTAKVTLIGNFHNFCKVGSSAYVNLNDMTVPFGSLPKDRKTRGEVQFGFCEGSESGCDLSLFYSKENKLCEPVTACNSDVTHRYFKKNRELEQFVESLYTQRAVKFSWTYRKDICSVDALTYMRINMEWNSEFSGRRGNFIGGPPASGENTSASVQNTSASVQNTSASVQNTSASVQNTSASVQNTSASVQNTSASVQNASASVQNASASVQNASASGEKENHASLRFDSIKLLSNDSRCESNACSRFLDSSVSKTDLMACLKDVSSNCTYTAKVTLTGKYFNFCTNSSASYVNLNDITIPFGRLPKVSEIKGLATFGFCGDIESGCDLSLLYRGSIRSDCEIATGLQCPGSVHRYDRKDLELREFVESLYNKNELEVALVKDNAICGTEDWRYMELDMSWNTEFSGEVRDPAGHWIYVREDKRSSAGEWVYILEEST